MLGECLAFIKKDFFIMRSYKVQFVTRWLSILSSLLIWFFISKIVKNNSVSYLSNYGGEYFPFLLVGITFASYVGATVGGFAANISGEQLTGTLEFLFIAPLKTTTILLSMSLWQLLNASINVMVYLLFGIVLLGVRFNHANIFAVMIILFLAIICFSSLGIISASFIIVFKSGIPLYSILNGFSNLFGGVFFPIAVLPKWLQIVSHCFPMTYFLRALRQALLLGYPLSLMANDIIILALFSLGLLTIGTFSFKSAVKIAKINASLSTY